MKNTIEEPKLITLRLPPELLRQIDDYRHERRHDTKIAAFEALLRAGLKANPPAKAAR